MNADEANTNGRMGRNPAASGVFTARPMAVIIREIDCDSRW